MPRPDADPDHELNGPDYHTGKPCIEAGCTLPAGTAWSPHWCQPHNAARLDRISHGLRLMARVLRRREDANALDNHPTITDQSPDE